jgi:hypothetical protein
MLTFSEFIALDVLVVKRFCFDFFKFPVHSVSVFLDQLHLGHIARKTEFKAAK